MTLRAIYAVVSAAIAAAAFGGSAGRAATIFNGAYLSGNPLGVNVTPRETVDLNSVYRRRMDAAIKALGTTSFRYGGGTFADTYDWQISRDTYNDYLQSKQSDNFTGPGSHYDALDFTTFTSEARSIGASGMVTINYGTGTPSMAAAWATEIAQTRAPVNYIEVGNEPYGCGSADLQITTPPVSDTSYEPNDPPTCPYTVYGSGVAGLEKFAESYIAHVPPFFSALRAANPAVKLLLPYAISPPGRGGYAWNDAVMPVVRGYSGINVLWYPVHVSGTQYPPQTVLSWVTDIPGLAAGIKSDIAHYAPGAFWIIGEENISNHRTYDICQPVAAVFAAGSALSWLAAGAQSVNWWEAWTGVNTGGNCVDPDYAMFDNTGFPQPPYTGFLLASKLAQPHAILSAANSGNTNVLAFHSYVPGGKQAAAVVNLSATSTEQASVPSVGTGAVTVLQYSASQPEITQSVAAAQPATVAVPPDSVTVFVS